MKKTITYLIALTLLFSSCEKVIDIRLDEGTSQLAVDAFINNKNETQTIRLTKTTGYFNNNPAPPALNATVSVSDDLGNVFMFTDNANNGNYTWSPGATDTLIRPFHSYTLSVQYSSQSFSASSFAFPVPPIDSIGYKFQKQSLGTLEGYYPAFYATDIPDMANFYWIRSAKNDIFYTDPAFINTSQDGAFSGEGADGFLFILPIRENIIPFNQPLAKGDSISVELVSITPDTYFFLQSVQIQSQNGLFASPPANVNTNIKNTNPASSVKPVGFFNAGMVSVAGRRMQ